MTKPKGTAAVLEKENRQLKDALAAQRFELENLRSKVVEKVQPIFMEHFKQSMHPQVKVRMLESCRKQLREMFMWVNKDKRTYKRDLYDNVTRECKEALEDWIYESTNWKVKYRVKSITMFEGKNLVNGIETLIPNKDFMEIQFTHPCRILGKLKPNSVHSLTGTDDAEFSYVVRINRYDIF